jgi:putative ABC transport system permease protein
MLSSLRSDLKYALRSHGKHPGVAFLALCTVALGVGASTAVFSVVNGVLLEPLPYSDPGSLVSIQVNSGIGSSEGFYDLSEPEFLDFGSQITSFEGIAGFSGAEVTLGDSLAPRRVRVLRTTAGLFPLLGVDPLLGRTFSADEDQPGAPRVVVLSHGMWQAELVGDPEVVGRSLILNDEPVTVIGVMPPGFAFPAPGWEAYSQLQLDRENPWERNNHYLPTLARLAPGATLREARSEMEVLTARSTRAYPEYYPNTGLRVQLRPLQDTIVGPVKTPLFILLAAVGFVLLTACVNVANLLVARGEARRREIAVRAAIGASRGRITRQIFTESFLLAALGGAAGILVAVLGIEVLLAMAPPGLPRIEEIGVDTGVLVFALLSAVGTGFLFGLMPVLQARGRDVQEALKEGGGVRGATRHGLGLSRTLVVAQVALAVVLVIGSGLMLRSVANLYRVDLGFVTDNILTFRINPRPSVYDAPQERVALYRELLSRINALPGVRAAAATPSLPMTGGVNNWSILIEGRPVANVGEAPAELVQRVTPEYLEALGLTLAQGRWFTHQDDAASPPVVVVTEAMARKHWPGEEPIGKRIKVFMPDWPWMEVVGVVSDVRHQGPGVEARPRWYVPHAQAHVSAYSSPLSTAIAVRSDRDPSPLFGSIEDVIREVDGSIPISNVRTMDQILNGAVGSQRFVMRLLTAFGILALFLAVVGAYGMVSFAVSRRTREIGLRMALGARASEVLGAVLGEGLILALAGVAIGLAGSLALSRVFESVVFGIAATDPLTYTGVGIVLMAAVALASLLPARRASRISPVQALRED